MPKLVKDIGVSGKVSFEKGMARLEPLSVLPVFFDLKGKTVLVAGNADGVLWKIELLCASGACVKWCAETDFSRVRKRLQVFEKRIVFVERDCVDEDFENKVLALGAFDIAQDAATFYGKAKRYNLPVNCIDQPAYCDFQFGSIVNRGPVIVSISTDGAAPILGQAIRQKIETLLPPALADWARAAKAVRPSLARTFPKSDSRKIFWRAFARAAFLEPAKNISNWLERNLRVPDAGVGTGHVTLVGAGPGDAELLTLKAVRALQGADVILFDALVSDEVLELARREAKRMLVGKRGGRASCKQDDINALMIKLAKQGKRVVRLKSGDPMIFGRAGEEIEILKRNGIAVSVVPGISAALAAAARLGVSLTHRDCAQGVKFITAHSRRGELPDADWQACADKTTTLMVYMGARMGPLLAQKLMDEGLPAQTPIVIAKGVSRKDECIETARLIDLCDMKISHAQPVLIGIGAVFEALMEEDVLQNSQKMRI
ncbi:MAG: uroporphyrinogen-III C-methyltransferase [Robiginitomaculum sp.]|nr:MAG: uroporphyrinogen-III C-methyltransferase [Robiginitomaculum sp.]